MRSTSCENPASVPCPVGPLPSTDSYLVRTGLETDTEGGGRTRRLGRRPSPVVPDRTGRATPVARTTRTGFSRVRHGPPVTLSPSVPECDTSNVASCRSQSRDTHIGTHTHNPLTSIDPDTSLPTFSDRRRIMGGGKTSCRHIRPTGPGRD